MLGARAQRGDHGESVPRGRRAGEEGADPWGRAVSGVGRRGLSGLLRERGVLGWLRRWAGADWAGVWQLGPGWFSI